MTKFKVGDKVIGTSNRYSITCRGWIGLVRNVRYDGRVIEVQEWSKSGGLTGDIYSVDSAYFDLYKSKKQTDMATKKKAATKKAVPKKKAVAKKPAAVATKATECDVELQDGDYFSADYKALRSKAAPVKIYGQVLEEDYDGVSVTFALCNRVVGDTAEEEDEYLGYNCALKVTVRAGENVKKALESAGITNYAVCKDARQIKVIQAQKNPQIEGHRVRKNGDTFIFGCGDFEISENDLKAVLRVTKACSQADLRVYTDTALEADAVGNIDISDVTAVQMEELLKM